MCCGCLVDALLCVFDRRFICCYCFLRFRVCVVMVFLCCCCCVCVFLWSLLYFCVVLFLLCVCVLFALIVSVLFVCFSCSLLDVCVHVLLLCFFGGCMSSLLVLCFPCWSCVYLLSSLRMFSVMVLFCVCFRFMFTRVVCVLA